MGFFLGELREEGIGYQKKLTATHYHQQILKKKRRFFQALFFGCFFAPKGKC